MAADGRPFPDTSTTSRSVSYRRLAGRRLTSSRAWQVSVTCLLRLRSAMNWMGLRRRGRRLRRRGRRLRRRGR
eukprot:6674024-Prymnesium_polylepis.1